MYWISILILALVANFANLRVHLLFGRSSTDPDLVPHLINSWHVQTSIAPDAMRIQISSTMLGFCMLVSGGWRIEDTIQDCRTRTCRAAEG